MARIAIFLLLVSAYAVLGTQATEVLQHESNIVSAQNYYPNDTLNLVTLGFVNGKKYLFASESASWFEASYFCNAHGMDLASIETQHENDLIMEELSKLGLTSYSFWISGHKIGRSTWLWINGDYIIFTDWEIGEPSEPYTDHCIQITNTNWDDQACPYYLDGFICEERELVTGREREPRSIYPGDLLNLVTLDPTTEKKYLFANASADWYDASYFCNAYGMDLVTIETQEENDLILDHIESLGLSQLMIYWTSAHKIGRSTWFWINEENMIFSDWASGEPNSQSNLHCMYIKGGNWYTDNCNSEISAYHSAFICESRELPSGNSTNITTYYPTLMMNLVNLGPGNGKLYLFATVDASWFEASYFCNAHGMDLVSIETQGENDAIMNHIGGSGPYFTSGHKISRATYLWINGEYMIYTDWAPGEPNEYSNSFIKIFVGDWYDNAFWDEYFVCEERII